jgi:hypothetical protein
MKSNHFMIAAAIAFVGVICIFNVDSYWADQHNANVFLIVFGGLLLAASGGWIAYNYLTQGGDQNNKL